MKLIDIDAARQALHRFCEGKERMCLPAQKDDDDYLISRALDELELARKKIKTYEQELKNYSNVSSNSGC